MKYITLFVIVATGLLNSTPALLAASIDDVKKQVSRARAQSAQVQTEIDQLSLEQKSFDQTFLQLTRQLEDIDSYNAALVAKIDLSQINSRNLSLQLDSVANIDREITPLMAQMHQSLAAFVAADIPFLKEHRASQILRLGEDIGNPSFSVSVKYRKLLEAFFEEDQYAQHMQSYAGSVKIDGLETQVNFLRLGRVALYYQRLDGSSSSLLDRTSGHWNKLDDESNAQLNVAINMASDVAVPKLVNFNLGRAPQ